MIDYITRKNNINRLSPARLSQALSLFGGVPVLAAVLVCGASGIAGAATLPDGRAYEMVTPIEKSGNQAGVYYKGAATAPAYVVATADGSGVLFDATGPIGETPDGIDVISVAHRSTSGWATVAGLPRGLGVLKLGNNSPLSTLPSTNLSRVVFVAGGSYVLGDEGPGGRSSANIFRAEGSQTIPAWLGQPTIADPIPALGGNEYLASNLVPAGGSPDLGIVYFTYAGTLTPQDDSSQRVMQVRESGAGQDWGFYEWREGSLTDAGELPDGEYDPYGAVPAATVENSGTSPDDFGNQVSAGGSRALFVSPSPDVCPLQPRPPNPECNGDTPELYMRETAPGGQQSTVLVSRSELLPPVGPRPAPAPDGPVAVVDPAPFGENEAYAYASPDGSHVFFESSDKLTADAPPGGQPLEYVFDVETEELRYLPGVVGPIFASSQDGSRIVFDNTISAQLDLWEAAGGGGAITEIAALPSPARTSTNSGNLLIGAVRATADGSVIAFETDSPLPGFNDAGGYEQVYRYDVSAKTLNCVSCPPVGVVPSGDAHLSNDNRVGNQSLLVDSRGISADGSRVFFDAPQALVPQDVNGVRDVYEWEDGHTHLISSGTGSEESFFDDNSNSGDDVFFTTAEGLVTGDTDGGYDIYDARIGGAPPPESVTAECGGDACQAAPSGSPFLPLPGGSGTAAGGGNLSPLSGARPGVRHKRVVKKAHKKRRAAKKPHRAKRASTRRVPVRVGR